ncbi:MAG: heme-binding domain-containing protein [Mariniphaga sp.]
MKKIVWYVIAILVATFLVMQFFQPERPAVEATDAHLFRQVQVPENIQTMLKTSCLDCHSDQTRYLWYHYIMPVGWMVNNHIEDGKADLNLSEWGDMELLDRVTALDKMCEEVEQGHMPLKSYLLMHRDAELSEEQKTQLCN